MQINFDAGKALDSLRDNGFYIAENALDGIWLSDLQTSFSHYIGAGTTSSLGLGVTRQKDTFWIDYPLTIHPNAVRVSICNEIIDLLSKYIGAQVKLSYSFAYRSQPVEDLSGSLQSLLIEEGVFKGWHSDSNLSSSQRGYRCVVAMLYLTDVSENDGGLWLVKGSHRYAGRKRDWCPNEFSADDVIEVNAPAGSIILFDMEMIHRAGTPINGRPRDIIRFMYSPCDGYTEHVLIPTHFIPSDLSDKQKAVLNFGGIAHKRFDISPSTANRTKSSLIKFLKANARKVVRRLLLE